MELTEKKEKMKLVLDANAFIKQQNLSSLAQTYNFYLPYTVSHEIKDKKAKEFLDSFPFELFIVNPSTDSYNFVKEFAKATGDLGVLSEEDLDYVGLCFELVKENGKTDLVRKVPPKFVSSLVKEYKTNLPSNTKKVEEKEIDEKKEDSEDSDGFMEITDKRKAIPVPKKDSTESQEENDSDSDDGDWITPSNVSNSKEKIPNTANSYENKLGVAAISSDFAIQNLLQQMGIPLITLDGVKIRHVKKWVKFCYTCQTVVTDVEKKFCPACGNETLNRLSCSVDDDGMIKCYFKKGYKYPIPKFKGGRKAKDLILREDELKMGGRDIAIKKEKKRKEKDFKEALFNLDNHFEIDTKKARKQQNLDIGYGRINPNDPRDFAKKKSRFK